jgi:hypothetical protein
MDMSTQMTDDEIRKIAVHRVRAKKGFFTHLTVYIIVNAFLVLIWAIGSSAAYYGPAWGMMSGRVYFWPAWVMAGWGIGLILHCLSVFVFHGSWEQNEVEKEVRRIKKNSGAS